MALTTHNLIHMNKIFFLLLLFLSFKNSQAQKFDKAEQARILSGDTAQMMKITQITVPEESHILKTASKDIAHNDPLLPLLAKRMYLSMRDTAKPGVGIAAPQVGINRNIIWVQRYDKEGEPFELYLNPKITWRSKLLKKGKEGCLSVPGERQDVVRHYAVKVSYLDLQGKHHEEIVEGYTAVIFQHETDHIRGILFTDRLKEQEQITVFPINDKVNLFLERLPARL